MITAFFSYWRARRPEDAPTSSWTGGWQWPDLSYLKKWFYTPTNHPKETLLTLDKVTVLPSGRGKLPETSDLSLAQIAEYDQAMRQLTENTSQKVAANPGERTAYLQCCLRTLPWSVMVQSTWFWIDQNLEEIFILIRNDSIKLQALLEVVPPNNYAALPGHCQNKQQIQILIEKALKNESLLEELTDIILQMIGDQRNSSKLDHLYRFGIQFLIERKGFNYIAQRARKNGIHSTSYKFKLWEAWTFY